MSCREQRIRDDDLGLLVRRAFEAQRSAEPPAAVLRAVRRQIAPATEGAGGTWFDRWTASPWPYGAYAAQSLAWSALSACGHLVA